MTSAGVDVVYRKTWLGPSESTRFSPGDRPTALDVDGWRLGLGICKDTGVPEHVAETAALGIDVYVAGLVHLPVELPVQDARGASIARQWRVHVVFASFAGPTGADYWATAGSSAVWSPAGTVLARAEAETGGMARTSIQ